MGGKVPRHYFQDSMYKTKPKNILNDMILLTIPRRSKKTFECEIRAVNSILR